MLSLVLHRLTTGPKLAIAFALFSIALVASAHAQIEPFPEDFSADPNGPMWIPPQDANSNGIIPDEEIVYDFEPAPVDSWFTWSTWDASFEAGVNGSDGNSKTFNMHTGFDLKRETELSNSTVKFRYNNNYTNQVQTQNNAVMNLGHEWLFPDGSPWSAFLNTDLFYDQFKAFDLRLVMNGGLSYTHIKTERTTLKTRYGAGVSREFGGPDDSWVPEALLGITFERQLTDKQKLTATADYYPEWGNFNDYRFVTDISWELLIDEEANLSLKLNVNDQYDSTPNGAKPNDLYYALLLLWKI